MTKLEPKMKFDMNTLAS